MARRRSNRDRRATRPARSTAHHRSLTYPHDPDRLLSDDEVGHIHTDRSGSVSHLSHNLQRFRVHQRLGHVPAPCERSMSRHQHGRHGNRVELRGFGAFSVKKRDARIGRNPRTGEAVEVEEKHVPFFKTGKLLRDRLNGNA